MFWRLFPALLLAVGVCYGCLSTEMPVHRDTVAIETARTGNQCRSSGPSPRMVWIGNDQQYVDSVMSMDSHILGGRKPADPFVDWQTHAFVMIHMGQKSTGGYTVGLTRPTARIHDEVAYLDVRWTEPSKGDYVTQALTSPCLLVKIEKGHYRSVVVVDQSGIQRTSVNSPE